MVLDSFTCTYLLHPLRSSAIGLPRGQVHLATHSRNLGPQLTNVCCPVLDSREHIGEEAVQQRNVLSHQLGHHRLTHALDQNLQKGIHVYIHMYIPYSGYFSGGKIFVSSEFLASSWKNFRGCGILRVRTPNYAVLFRG